jgi:spermidine synthase
MFTYWIFVLFFLSGFSALIYEIVWMRLLVLTLGVTVQATACVLAVFLGGLALGAYLSGRIADRLKTRALFYYGLVEVGVGILAPVATYFCASTPLVFVNLLTELPTGGLLTFGRIALCSLLLLPPTILMGASLPLLTRYLTERNMSAQQFFSKLYAINTLGGVAGSLAACFVGIPYLGLNNTVLAAAAVNIAVGATAMLAGRKSSPQSEKIEEEIATRENSLSATLDPRYVRTLCLIAGLTGVTAMSYEVLWTRMMRFATTSSTYAFTAIVSVFLLGLVLGSLIFNRWIKKNEKLSIDEQLIKFAHFQFFAAIACSTSLLLIPFSFLLRSIIPQMLGYMSPHAALLTFLGITTILFMLLPATMIGISFPMITSMASTLSRNVANAVGTAFAANTIGCMLGTTLVGLILIPSFGSYTTFQVTVLFTVLTGVFAVAVSTARSGRQKLLMMTLPTALALSFLVFVQIPMEKMLAGLNVLKCGEDVAGTVLVLKWPDHKQLIMNGEGYSSTIMRGRRYMRLLGHLPMLVNKNPQDALVICFGMGTTAGAVSLHPELKSEDVVELSPMVVSVGNLFRDTNYGVLDNAKVHVRVDDGRNWLLRCQKKYDVITLEPPPPSEAGVTNLYSREFYALMKAHLKPGGVACQWLPMHETAGRLWRMMAQSALLEFPYCSAFESNNSEFVMLCSEQPITVDLADVKRRIEATPLIRQSLVDVGLNDEATLLGTFVADQEQLKPFVGDVPPVTDDKAQIEFFLPYNEDRHYCYDVEQVQSDISKVLQNPNPEDVNRLTENRNDLSFIRKATRAKIKGDGLESTKLLNEGLKRAPENNFFKYAVKHPSLVLN